MGNQIHELAAKYPWPNSRPEVQPNNQAFFRDDTKLLFIDLLKKSMSVIVELGSFVGTGSTRFLIENSDATLICVDPWIPSAPEDKYQTPLLLYETFCYNVWPDRDRIIPLRMDSSDGLREIAGTGIVPDLIYIDGNHEYEYVIRDLNLITQLFKNLIVVGDDFCEDFPGVGKAVVEFTRKQGISFRVKGSTWMLNR
jgi:hypothetical protein